MSKIPTVVNYNIPKKVDDPFDKGLYEIPLSKSFKGKVNRNGKWWPRLEPAAGWVIEKIDTGKYLITHGMNNIDVSISVSLINKHGKIGVVSTTPMSFEVNIQNENNQYTDEDFVFSVSFRFSS